MAVRMDKPWQPLEAQALTPIGGQTGVYELGDNAGNVVYIGTANSRSLFGLKGELENRLGTASQFRFEITTAYTTRQRELLMAHFADHGRYPEQSQPHETRSLGRLSP